MKLLAADIGNTNVTLGLFDESELIGSWRGTTQAAATDDEVAVLVGGLLALGRHALEEVETVAVASVVPPLTTTFTRMIRARTGQAPLIVDARGLEGILEIEIDRPAEAGADRLVNALAARNEFGGPAIVIDRRGPISVVRSRPASASPWRRWSGRRASCRGSSCAVHRTPSAPTPCMPCRAARSLATSGW